MRHTHTSVLILFAFYLHSCVEPYSPNISKYEDIFVVDGELSNLPGPYEVRLSRSYEFYKHKGDPVKGAKVKFYENTGLEVELNEISDGVYSTAGNPFQGIVGNSYKLQIILGDEIYESDFETIKNPIPIDSVYWEYQVLDNGQDGIRLLLDTHDPMNSTRYYAWYLDETWKFREPIEASPHPEWLICYKYNSSTNFNIATSARRNNDIIEGQSLGFFSEKTNRIYLRYTTMVKQYALTEPSYKFFKDLISINQDQGTLFDPIPSSLVGNIKSLSNNDLPVLGYFLVAGVSEKRIFIDRKETPKEYMPTDGFDGCYTEVVYIPIEPIDMSIKDEIDFYKTDPEIIDSLYQIGYVEYERVVMGFGTGADPIPLWQLSLAKPFCFNCTLSGKNEVPEFWTEYPNKY